MAGRHVRLIALAVIYLVVAHVLPAPEGVDPQGWRITAIFFATIAGLMLQPLPGSQVVLLGITALVLVGRVPLERALTGYATASVWLVLAAMLMSRALRDSGLARRIALWFVRAIGRTSLGLAYALHLTDLTLATGVPSITARGGSIVFPIARSISTLYQSEPGPTSSRLATFLMTSMYQTSGVASAMFFYSSAANLLMGDLARQVADIQITWASWFLAGLVPGIVSSVLIPPLVMRVLPPEVRNTPAAPEFAQKELDKLGPVKGVEAVVAGVFVGLIGFWVLSSYVDWLSAGLVALVGMGVLFISGALTWKSALSEHSAWDIYVWYGGLITMGGLLNESGSTAAFASFVGGWLAGIPWLLVLVLALVLYFYAHYFFASTTAHALALYGPFVALLAGAGAPVAVAVYALVYLNNLQAGLTHYGTTTSPIIFVENYVSFADWWRAGFIVSLLNLAVWLTVGIAWWRMLGLW